MNIVVKDRYPVSQLPDDLKAEIGQARYVKLVIEEAAPKRTREELARIREESWRRGPIGDDPVERIRRLRDEWDD
ncbi:MAG TPA: hypothetical protein PKA74_01675 [Bauldia sp.]|nr:hypothetical protein [Bauldia sp.]